MLVFAGGFGTEATGNAAGPRTYMSLCCARESPASDHSTGLECLGGPLTILRASKFALRFQFLVGEKAALRPR